MRIVNFTDEKGYLRTSLIKDEDPDSMAKYGIPVEIPDLEALDWDGFKRDLHNSLTQAEFYTLEDVMKSGQAFAPAMTVLKRYLTEVYTLERVITQDKSSGG
jgi:hypothetical protein